MKTIVKRLRDAGEYYAAGLLENKNDTPLLAFSRATADFFAHAALPPYDGRRLYPCGLSLMNTNYLGAVPEYSYTWRYLPSEIEKKVPEAVPYLNEIAGRVAPIWTPHIVGGAGYTHSFINFRRILHDGLNGYRSRVEALPEGDFRLAMTVLLDGIETLRQRMIAYLESEKTTENAERITAIIDALSWVPNHTPRNIYEAIIAWNFVYYVDGCDDLGGLDRGLYPYWHGENIEDLLKELYSHVDINNGWSSPLGPHYNELTVQCLHAARNCRRPSIQLLVTEDMPDAVWEAAYASIGSGCGQPALYNWHGFQREVKARLPQVTDADMSYMAFGGCTETMIEGLSNVGSDDAGINTALIFDHFFREHLRDYTDFDAFLEGYCVAVETTIDEVCAILEEHRKTRAAYRPQPIRTLLIDDCIDKQVEFNAGGARYNWSVMNVAGMINVIDSMAVIEKLVFAEKKYTADDFIALLDSRDPAFLALCKNCPKHGNDDIAVNRIADIVSDRVFSRFETHTCTPDGKYFAVSNQFVTYADAGVGIRATPDGRADNDPLCDSCGAIHGRDVCGPTAMLKSVTALNLGKVLGTPVTNLRMAKAHIDTLLKPMVQGFFAEGGMQLQITCASREELLDALAHPEQHENLVVRIGGYAEYFNRLTPVLKQTVIDRTEY